LLSYTKIALYEELLASDVPDDPQLLAELERYFPTAVRQRFRRRLAAHPLRREIVAAQVTNGFVNRAGTSFLFRLSEETGAAASGSSFAEVAGVYFAIDERLELHALRARIGALPREERWEALARRALQEDLASEQRALTADVLRESEDGAAAADRVSSWLAH